MANTKPAANRNASDRKEDARVGYQVAVSLWTYEGEQNWARFNVMLVANSIIIAVLGLAATSQLSNQGSLGPLSVVLSVVGLLLSAAWFLITVRGFDYQKYSVHHENKATARARLI